MPELLRMPEVAANTTEAVLLRWPIPVNTPFKAHDTIAMVETAKAVVDVEAETDGVLLATLVAEGAEVVIGEPIALLGEPGEQVDDLGAALAVAGVQRPAIDAKSSLALDVPEADRESSAPAPPVNVASGRIFVSPLARRLARDAGLTLEEIEGSGPNERILRRDVEAAIARRTVPATVQVRTDPDRLGPYVDRPHTRARRAVAARLLESKQTIPHFYLRGRARVDGLLRLRADFHDVASVRVSLNDLIVKAVALAHERVPEMNVIWTADAVRSFSSVDIGVAVDTGSGLVSPVLRGVETLTIADVARATSDYAARARAGEIRQHELEGGTITVTNLGMFGTEEFSAIINPPQSAILAVGAAVQEPVVDGGVVAAASVMRLTLAVDHRPLDGVTAARWMKALIAVLEKPVQLFV